ncbi:hypothetical protein BH10ACT2_BH10ACT2_17670 [soil metagenome]
MKEALSNQAEGNSTAMVVRAHDAVDLLLNMQAAKNLAPFMRCEQSLGTAAAELDRRPSSLAYWVRRFRQAGLLVVAREEPRAGKAIPFYRAAADEFRVPFDAMPAGARDQFLHGARKMMVGEFASAAEKAMRTYYADGLSIKGHPPRGMSISFIEPTDGRTSPVTEWWGKVSLTRAEAEQLQREMDALVARYNTDHLGSDRSRYLIMVGIAPTKR